MKVPFVLLLLASNRLSFSDATSICGDPTSTYDIAVATKEIVNRLMATRQPDWGWHFSTSTAVIAALQVSAPELFFGRDRTAKALEKDIKDNYNRLSIHSKGYYIIAAKSLCMDPYNVSGVNLVKGIKDDVMKIFRDQYDPYGGRANLTLSHELGALCVAGDPIEKWVIDKILSIQNKDGSFAKNDVMHETLAMLESMQCVVNAPTPGLNVAKLKRSIRKMRRYVINVLNTPGGQKRLSLQGMPSLTMIALWKTKKPNDKPNKQWRCSDITNVLGVLPLPGEKEYELTSRLMRLHRASFLDPGQVGYKCIGPDEIVPVPENYVPTCNYFSPKTCEPKKN